MFESVIDTLTPWFEEWGLLIVFVATFVESSIVVASFLPGESVLLLGGFFASPSALLDGPPPMQLVDVVLVGIAGAVLGDVVGYGIGRAGGRAIVRRFGRYLFLSERRVRILEGYFERYGARAILFGRFAPFLRSIRTLLAGIARMPILRFFLPDIVGAVVWVTAIAATGFVLGESWRVANRYLGAGGAAVLILLIGLFVVTWRRVRARIERELAAAEAGEGNETPPQQGE